MSDSDNTKNDKPAPKRLQLTKTVETGHVQQTFARGRSKTVTVEMKRTRTFSRDGDITVIEKPKILGAGVGTEEESSLTKGEKEARLKALELAKSQPKQEIPPTAPTTDKVKPEEKPLEKKQNVDEIIEAPKADKPSTRGDAAKDKKSNINDKTKTSDKKPKIGTEKKRSKGKLTISNALEQEERVRSLASIKRARQKAKRQINFSSADMEKTVREVTIPESIMVQELANRMAERSQDVVKELMKLGIMATGTQTIDADTAELIVAEFGHTIKRVTDADVEDILKIEEPAKRDLEPRPPVVTIMGHVDHGKTSLLDAIRSTNVTDGEAGGITQHIGAYQVKTKDGSYITFLDTPGHEAFTAMRARGAKVTDIVVLVVAADDGVMPQTEEAINHAKAADVPIIVAVNKIDKPEANPKKVKDELLAHELISEDLGGDTMIVEVSAKTKLNLDRLLETILLQTEMMELKASKKQRASGAVIEAKIDKGKGVIVTLLVQRGSLKKGDIIVAGTGFGKIKVMADDKNSSMKTAAPSTPVEVLGLDKLPAAGDEFSVVDTEKQAREIIEYRTKRERDLQATKNIITVDSEDEDSMDRLFQTAKEGTKELRLIIKGDVQGSIEAITGSLAKYSSDEVKVKIIHSAAGGITESDVTLASAVGAIILGFNVRASGNVRELASEERVEVRYYSVIYDLIDDMKAVVSGLMDPIIKENFIGNAEIIQVFKMSKSGKVAGCKVTEGSVKRGAGVRLIRDDVVIHEGKLKILKRFKDEVDEVKQGTECGMSFENYEDLKEGDTIEAFEFVEEQRTL